MKYNALSRVVAVCGMSAWMLMMCLGCKPAGSSSGTANPAETQPDEPAHGHDHGHEDTGPHDGHIVEIGNEQLHAEWTHDDASGEVTVYLLDDSAKSDVAISAGSILITTKIGETEKSYELLAVSSEVGSQEAGSPEAGSPEAGQSSRFALTDPSLVEALKAVGPGVEATITVQVDDEPLVGKFEHQEHGGHKH